MSVRDLKLASMSCLVAACCVYLIACDNPIEPDMDVSGMAFELALLDGRVIPYMNWYRDSTESVEFLGGTLVFTGDSVFIETTIHTVSPHYDDTHVENLRGSYGDTLFTSHNWYGTHEERVLIRVSGSYRPVCL